MHTYNFVISVPPNTNTNGMRVALKLSVITSFPARYLHEYVVVVVVVVSGLIVYCTRCLAITYDSKLSCIGRARLGRLLFDQSLGQVKKEKREKGEKEGGKKNR